MRGLYIHIPFCKSICSYCDFPKRLAKEKMIDDYLALLERELNKYRESLTDISTIYIGGGTPNSLNYMQLERLLKLIDDYKLRPIEYSIELNPEFVDQKQIELFLKYKINRVSLGVQSFSERLLKILKRNHSLEIFNNCLALLKANYLTNINIDLIHSIPTQKIEDLEFDLSKAISLDIKHISYYGLQIEEKTEINLWLQEEKFCRLDEESEICFINTIRDKLKANGFYQYEISNFAKKGFNSKHNMLYWQNKEYIGIGAGASGYINNVRYTNNRHIKDYQKIFINESEYLTEESKLCYEIIMGLRLIEGINIANLNNKYKIDFFAKYPKVENFLHNNLLQYNNFFLSFTEEGINLSNQILEIFV